ncbi:TPA: hypothetical protein N2N45_004277 [Klebsiella aerogenes]|nr:hypothetical protein [Klebsiella aerogenes]
MIDFLTNLLTSKKKFESIVISKLSFLEARIENLNERIRLLEGTVVTQANSIASLTNRYAEKACSEVLPDKDITNGKLSTKKARTSGISRYRTDSSPSGLSSSYADDGARSQLLTGNTRHSYDDQSPTAGHHHIDHHGSNHDISGSQHSHGDFGGYDSGCSDSSFFGGSCD